MLSVIRSPLALVAAAVALVAPASALPTTSEFGLTKNARRWAEPIAPKFMVITMFAPERGVFLDRLELYNNVTVPGLSPLFPHISCNAKYEICMLTTGESEINAATSTTALFYSPDFDLKLTYFMVAGIAGMNPYEGTLASAAFARFAIQVALQYELDARQMPSNWTTGYWAFGTKEPGIRPPLSDTYGTELYELNTNLLARVMDLTKDVKLNDSTDAVAYRAKFDYAPANEPPKVISCDVATSDVYYAGTLLSESFGNFTSLLTNGTGKYCTTAQEDNATLESAVRATLAGYVDYSRFIVLRTASDFDRAPPPSAGLDAYAAFEANQGGFLPALDNLWLAGWPVIKEVVYDWQAWKDGTPTQSKKAPSFYGNIFGSLLEE